MLLLTSLLAATLIQPSPATNPFSRRWASTDQYNGKQLSSVNTYTVLPGIFIQDDPELDASGYNVLNDSFGLIDKSANRWTNLTQAGSR